MIRSLSAFISGSDRGNIAVSFALLLPLILGFGGFATDLGLAYLERRSLQAATDAAALAAIRHPHDAEAIAAKVFAASSQKDATFDVVFGSYEPDRNRDERFRPEGSSAVSVVRVEARKPHHYTLARVLGVNGVELSASADASLNAQVVFQAGSRLMKVDPPVLNAVLREIVGAELSLTALDYNNLIDAQVRLGDLFENAPADGSSTPDVAGQFGAKLSTSALFMRVSEALRKDGRPVAAASMRKAAQSSLSLTTKVTVSNLINLGPDGVSISRNQTAELLNLKLSALDIVEAAVRQTIHGSGTDVSLNLPLIADVDLSLMVGEPMKSSPSLAVAGIGEGIETGQARLRLRAATVELLAALGIGVDLPLEAIVAGGRAEVASVACAADPLETSVTLAVTPGIARLSIGRWTKDLRDIAMGDQLAHAEIAKALLARVDARGNLSLADTKPVLVTFTGREIAAGTLKTARTTSFVSSPLASLFGQTRLTVRTAMIGVSSGSLTNSVRDRLTDVAAPLDDLLADLLDLAGVGLGEIDVKIEDVLCSNARLVG
ncbi:hypothetical protein FP2506_15234 [Fulvimarina pelagi HTCC2506]|uniref:Putative Flp pilus-assembly TadG-like N-terminal domain-containing protein n=1 Tax=Fulvimarina pelagi HTCC2506 TaxID=314231 RepID=Q0G3N3_9HYPH|nr:pilus assembly protein TadG-related protein [Fulvimarina pelagi]EAU41798.1 hypothetical protein FP2506_15234 [Fulvimarina pelagi HTCC2506]